jgi:hypothetical protein
MAVKRQMPSLGNGSKSFTGILQFHPAGIVSITIAIAEPSPVRHDLPVRRSILLNFRPPLHILILFNLF